jgi:tripartite-type tricarboxylate transporter receptor subunit TctC
MLARAVVLVALASVMALASARAQNWPTRPVKLVVPFGAGGNTDVVARILAARVGSVFGQPFVVENHPGAAGVIGAEIVARAEPDGYTLLMASQPQIAIVPAMRKTSYDPIRDFVPISEIGTIPFALVVRSSLPVTSLKEFLDYVRSHPNQLTYVVTGFGSVNHLTMMLLLKRDGLAMRPVIYKGGPGGLTDVMSGRIDAYFGSLSLVYPQLASSSLRLLAVTSERRLSRIPQVATLAESGFPDLKVLLWAGLFGPAGMPRDIVERVAGEAARATRDPKVDEVFAGNGIEPLGDTPDQFAATIAADVAFWRDAIRITGVTTDEQEK